MVHAPFTLPSVQTPMERIFEKVMLRKMTDEEKEILELNAPFETSSEHPVKGLRISRKKKSRLPDTNAAKLTSV
jgi:hypothetical protein